MKSIPLAFIRHALRHLQCWMSRLKAAFFHNTQAAQRMTDNPKVLKANPPIPPFETQRLQDLYSLEILDTAVEERFDRYTRLVADLFKVPVALINLIDPNRQWSKSGVGMQSREVARDISFCAYTITCQFLVVPDLSKDARFANNPLVVGESHLRFYAGVHVRGPAGMPIGTLCILDYRPRDLSELELKNLKAFAKLVEQEIRHVYDIKKVKAAAQAAAEQTIHNLRNIVRRLRFALNAGQAAVLEWNIKTGQLEWEQDVEKVFGRSPAELSQGINGYFNVIHPEDRNTVQHKVNEVIASKNDYGIEHRVIWPDGTSHWIDIKSHLLRDASGEATFFIGTAADITERKQAEIGLREALSHAKALAEAAPVGFFDCNAQGQFIYVNERWCEITGLQFKQALSDGWQAALYPDDRQFVINFWQEHINRHEAFMLEFRMQQPEGDVIWVTVQTAVRKREDGQVIGHIGTLTDITDRKNQEDLLRHSATTDELTHLPNRLAALDRIELAIHQARRDGRHVGVMYIDLDNFKTVNDTFGHAIGDRLLIQVAKRLTAATREGHTVARLAGDEFLIVMPDLDSVERVEPVARRVLHVLEERFRLNGNESFISASIGIACFPDDGNDADSLLRNADMAMYSAKDGRNTFQFFMKEMNLKLEKRARLEFQLRHALELDELSMYYQPIFDIRTNQLAGAEALLRWKNPALGNVSPESFIRLAEETGLIVQIGEWALTTACSQAKDWSQFVNRPLRVAVNVSSRQFRDPYFLKRVRNALAVSNLPCYCLELEITESLLLNDAPKTGNVLQALHNEGVRLIVDDFGIGYSSLSYLKRLPVSSLKVDRSFVEGVHQDPDDAALVRAIIDMGHGLGLKVTGEGIENAEQWEFLKESGCDSAQGFLLSQPLEHQAFQHWMKQGCHTQLPH